MTLTKLEDAEGNEHMFEIGGECGPCLGPSYQPEQQLSPVIPVLLLLTTTTLCFLLFYHALSEFWAYPSWLRLPPPSAGSLGISVLLQGCLALAAQSRTGSHIFVVSGH